MYEIITVYNIYICVCRCVCACGFCTDLDSATPWLDKALPIETYKIYIAPQHRCTDTPIEGAHAQAASLLSQRAPIYLDQSVHNTSQHPYKPNEWNGKCSCVCTQALPLRYLYTMLSRDCKCIDVAINIINEQDSGAEKWKKAATLATQVISHRIKRPTSKLKDVESVSGLTGSQIAGKRTLRWSALVSISFVQWRLAWNPFPLATERCQRLTSASETQKLCFGVSESDFNLLLMLTVLIWWISQMASL
jgi:hypothetical protein